MVTGGVISAVVVVLAAVADSAVSWHFPGGLVGCGGLSLVYLSTLSLGGATSIE